MQDDDRSDDNEGLSAGAPTVVVIRNQPVMLAAVVARAFDVETREVTQAIKRNPQKFNEKHAFELTDEEKEVLRSQAVISGRGWTPTVLTQKGVVRLATVLNAPKALEATDLIIDLFVDIYTQLQQGRTEVVVSNSSRLISHDDETSEIKTLRKRIIKAVGDLLDTTIDTKTNTTIGDVLGDTATSVYDHLKALLKSQQLKNDQLAADTLLIIEKTRDMFERRQADLKRSHAETEKIMLENVGTKIELVQKLLAMTNQLEPGALAQMLPQFGSPILLPVPKRPKRISNKD